MVVSSDTGSVYGEIFRPRNGNTTTHMKYIPGIQSWKVIEKLKVLSEKRNDFWKQKAKLKKKLKSWKPKAKVVFG